MVWRYYLQTFLWALMWSPYSRSPLTATIDLLHPLLNKRTGIIPVRIHTFIYNGDYYKQTDWVAMGFPLVPSYRQLLCGILWTSSIATGLFKTLPPLQYGHMREPSWRNFWPFGIVFMGMCTIFHWGGSAGDAISQRSEASDHQM